MARLRPAPLRSDRGDIVLGWLVKVVVVLAALGVAGFDGISIGSAKVSVVDEANTAATAGSDVFLRTHDVNLAFAASVTAAESANPLDEIKPTDYSVDADGTVHLTLRRLAPTLVLQHVPPVRSWAEAVARVSVKSMQ
jgi:hypothetical protein